MKKIFVSFGVLALGLGAFGLRGNQPKVADATEYTGVAALLHEFAEGNAGNQKYTKKTSIFVKTEVEGYDAAYFHAGNQQFRRTTYYAPGVLLMGDLEGGFTYINSGYANNGANMDHFDATGEDKFASLEDSSKRHVDYTVTGKNMSDYFYGLAELADLSLDATKWTEDGGVYTHTITDLSVSGEYNDPLLKGFQYFAAPMLLTHRASDSKHYFSPSSIKVQKQNGVLSIKIYAASDTGKLWSNQAPYLDTGLMAEARVYKDIVLPGYFLLGDFSNWEFDNSNRMGDGDNDNYAKSLSFDVSLPGAGKAVHLRDDGYFDWIGQGGNNSNVVFDHNGTFNFYARKDGHLYCDFVSVAAGNVMFKITPSEWDNSFTVPNNDDVYIAGDFTSWADNKQKMTRNGDTFSITINLSAGDHEYKYIVHGSTNNMNWNALQDSNRQIKVV